MLHTACGTRPVSIHKIFYPGMARQVKTTARTSRQWAVLLSPWNLIIQRVKEKECEFTKLLQFTMPNFVDIDETLAPMAPPPKGSATARIDPVLLYAKLQKYYCGYVVSFDGSVKTAKPVAWKLCLDRVAITFIEIAANAHMESTMVNIAEYIGMNNGVEPALMLGAEVLASIQQFLVVNEALMGQLNRHKEITKSFKSVKYPHVIRQFNAATDSLATNALESKTSKVVLSETRKTELSELNRIQEMIYDSAADTIRVKEAEMRT
ncbi:LOW QUALITY PROTEIN: hypothetical protein PHMEG_0001236 [Phytophthora megakarya]|uniref:RNase H type-1 domain-containing protein n=1 Tax=Phytophthora megakarya TaxID=4795 RepID=A0A225X1P3_9STRA|nr:LOW QUALITY PROTEIN: hypothetical protein PHMEG_0001236 [Phytophthora megakarya]